jgi:hypothetical protein
MVSILVMKLEKVLSVGKIAKEDNADLTCKKFLCIFSS